MSKKKKKLEKIHEEEAVFEKKCWKQRAKKGYSDQDVWNIERWFLDIMPRMIQEMRDNLHSFPDFATSFPGESHAVIMKDEKDPPGMIEWKNTLDRMRFLLSEMNEDSCSYKNPYKKEYEKTNDEFIKKYGILGDKLKSKKQKKEEKKKGSYSMMTPRDFPDLYPGYDELENNYFKYVQNKHYYMDRCREEFFQLFSRHFWSMWD